MTENNSRKRPLPEKTVMGKDGGGWELPFIGAMGVILMALFLLTLPMKTLIVTLVWLAIVFMALVCLLMWHKCAVLVAIIRQEIKDEN